MKIVFLAFPAHGHVTPMLPLTEELVARGHEVVHYQTGEFEASLRRTGATFRRLDHSFALPADAMQASGDGATQMKRMLPLILRIMTKALRQSPGVIERVRAESADAVAYDPMCAWGKSAAAMLKLPAFTFYTSYAPAKGSSIERRMKAAFRTAVSLDFLRGLAKLEATSWYLHLRHGLPRFGMKDMFAGDEKLNIVPVPLQFHPEPHLYSDRFLFVGPSVTPRGDRGDFPLEQLEGRPTLFISLGTTPMNQLPRFYDDCFEAFGNTRWQVVLATGANAIDTKKIPPNFLVRPRVPQIDVLERSRVFITHGGMNSTMEALLYGVPLVVFPQMIEQAITAGHVAARGLGRSLDGIEVNARVLREAVEAVDTAPSYRERVKEFQPKVTEGGGYKRAADAIEKYLSHARRTGSG